MQKVQSFEYATQSLFFAVQKNLKEIPRPVFTGSTQDPPKHVKPVVRLTTTTPELQRLIQRKLGQATTPLLSNRI